MKKNTMKKVPLLISIWLALSTIASHVLASDVVLASPLLTCSSISNDIERLACFDKVVSEIKRTNEIVNTPTSDTRPKVVEQSRSIANESTPIKEKESSTTIPQAIEPKKEQPVTTLKNNTDVQEQTQTVNKPQTQEEIFGIEERIRPEQRIDKIYATVSKVNESRFRDTTYVLENGQVWVKEDNSRLTIRKGDTIYIERGILGAFYMGKDSQKRRIKVDRLK